MRGRLTDPLTSDGLENTGEDPQTSFYIIGEFSFLEGVGFMVVN